MALFGRNKKAKPEKESEEIVNDDIEEEEDEAEETEGSEEETALDPNEQFKKDCETISRSLRVLFPKQLLVGFYYAELQSGGYIDDFCCYASDGRLLERQDIPKLCGISLPDMVSREEKLEKAFFSLLDSAEKASGKVCRAVSLMILSDGQVKVDLTANELVDGEEEKRYNAWRQKVEAADPKKMRPAISPEKIEELRSRTSDLNKQLGTEFYSFLPGEDFKIAYFYAENGENGIFYHHRLITNDGEIIDGDELFDRYEMDKEEAAANRIEVVKLIMQLMQTFKEAGERPFSMITLSVTGKGEFSCDLGFGATDAAGEQARLEAWKDSHKG